MTKKALLSYIKGDIKKLGKEIITAKEIKKRVNPHATHTTHDYLVIRRNILKEIETKLETK